MSLSARPPLDDPERRTLLSLLAALAPAAVLGWTGSGAAAEGAAEAGPALGPALPFSYDALTAEMQARAAAPWQDWQRPNDFWSTLTYDDFRLIRFNEARSLWRESGARYRMQAFHAGWLFGEPVHLFEVADGMARELRFSTADFEYLNDLAQRIPPQSDLPGVAGFRLNAPLNRADKFDEVVSFLGASYFRALGRGTVYGLSARGIAIDTVAAGRAEEFPRFTRFWLERPAPGAEGCALWAGLEGPSLTGAYRFALLPGDETVMEVEARLFFRADVALLGVAPLTSMFLFDAKNRAAFDDYRPAVHDSNGLRIRRRDGDVLWRPLNNPARVATSFFAEDTPRGFGLYQRVRDFAAFEDPVALYHDRPTLEVEPLEDWGRGSVALVELPAALEAQDNIVAFWVPEVAPRAGESRRYAYRLRWGRGEPDVALARVAATRAGQGGVSGVAAETGTRKFVVDFRGGALDGLATDVVPEPVTAISGGTLRGRTLDRLSDGTWRLVLDVTAPSGATVELSAHLAGPQGKLTEVWLYQWMRT